MLHVCPWIWGDKYGPQYVSRLQAGFSRHLRQPHTFRAMKPGADDEYLTRVPGCFARLRMFDPAWQAGNRFGEGDRLLCVDLDLIVTGSLDGLFTGPEPFRILQGANASNPCPYNGSLWYVDVGYRPDVWAAFSLEAAMTIPFYKFPDDQAWLAHKLPGAAGWKAGPESGVYAFHKPGWPQGDDVPDDARIVAFPGHRDPSQFTHLEWVRQHWIGPT